MFSGSTHKVNRTPLYAKSFMCRDKRSKLRGDDRPFAFFVTIVPGKSLDSCKIYEVFVNIEVCNFNIPTVINHLIILRLNVQIRIEIDQFAADVTINFVFDVRVIRGGVIKLRNTFQLR